ncbi:hypothetical protein BGX27_008362 [Mortierella sp. AM989]|nr:hypothetical protein BGX27_008362 [Mortierella sp. AM989]
MSAARNVKLNTRFMGTTSKGNIDIEDYGIWACHNLRTFQVSLKPMDDCAIEPMEKQTLPMRNFFAYLVKCCPRLEDIRIEQSDLRLNPETGLCLLSELGHLERLHITTTCQKVYARGDFGWLSTEDFQNRPLRVEEALYKLKGMESAVAGLGIVTGLRGNSRGERLVLAIKEASKFYSVVKMLDGIRVLISLPFDIIMQNHDHAMNIPEISAYVAQFLGRAQLSTAAAVCKSWNRVFTSELYGNIEWYGDGDARNPAEEVIKVYAHNIHTLSLNGNASRDFPSHDLTHLRSIRVAACMWFQSNWGPLLILLRRNPNLQSVSLYIGKGEKMQADELIRCLSYCPNLKTIRLTKLTLDHEDTEFLFQLCSRLHFVQLLDLSIPSIKTLMKLPESFPTLQHLRLGDALMLSTFQQLDIIRRCPQLTALGMNIPSKDYKIPEIRQVLTTYCPQLCSLGISSSHLAVDDLAPILESCRKLHNVVVPTTGFGPETFRALHKHFDSLTSFQGRGSIEVTSPMAQKILSSCRMLRIFSAGHLDAQDILGASLVGDGTGYQILHPQDWVCFNLQSLSVTVSGLTQKPVKWKRLIFQQLAKLEKLELLDIGLCDRHDRSLRLLYNYLGLQLDTGLYILATLKRLETLRFEGLEMELNEKDVRWMIQSWPQLSAVYGSVHYNPIQCEKLERILIDGGIRLNESDMRFEDEEEEEVNDEILDEFEELLGSDDDADEVNEGEDVDSSDDGDGEFEAHEW